MYLLCACRVMSTPHDRPSRCNCPRFKFIELQKLHTLTPELADDVFFFSSFFYKKLTSAVEGKSGAEELLAQARRAHGEYGGSMLHWWTCLWITPAGVSA